MLSLSLPPDPERERKKETYGKRNNGKAPTKIFMSVDTLTKAHKVRMDMQRT